MSSFRSCLHYLTYPIIFFTGNEICHSELLISFRILYEQGHMNSDHQLKSYSELSSCGKELLVLIKKLIFKVLMSICVYENEAEFNLKKVIYLPREQDSKLLKKLSKVCCLVPSCSKIVLLVISNFQKILYFRLFKCSWDI